jgi:hypothetical protein
MRSSVGSIAFALPLFLEALLGARPAAAAPDDAAAAQALFYEARTLMKSGDYAAACPKLEQSLRLDHGMGTQFNLADCDEKIGKVASAWAGFIDVATTAKTQNQPQREKLARDRAAALEPRLPTVTIVPSETPPDLEVKRDGAVVGSATWRTPVPVDPGPHHVTVSAPGRLPWETDLTLVEGQAVSVAVPPLVPIASAPVPAPPPAPSASETPQPPAPREPFPEPVVEAGSTQRTLGWITLAAGVAGLGVGLAFGIDSLVHKDQSKPHCTGDVCDAQGLTLRDHAITSGNVSTITSIAGGVALASGIILVLSAPHPPKGREATAGRVTSLVAAPRVGTNGGGIAIEGAFP